MIINYLQIAIRNIKKHKGYSFINIFGLAIGMACCLLISLWVLDELSYDKFHMNAPYLYRVEQNQNFSGRMFHVLSTPHGLAPSLEKEIPDIKNISRYSRLRGLLFRYGEKAFFELNVKAVDPSFLQMFTFPLLKGDINTALSTPQSIVISEKVAQKYFENEDPIGKTITINNKDSYQVTGLIKNVPHNSYLQFDALLPYEFLRRQGINIENLDTNEIETYVQIHPNVSKKQVDQKISGYFKARIKESNSELELIAYTRLHLFEYFGYQKGGGDIKYVYIFSIIAIFVLLMACINFMNLTTARSVNRAREVGLRKVMGALRSHLIRQFYGEATIFSIIALISALVIVQLLLPSFSTLTGKVITFQVIGVNTILLLLLGIALFTGMVAGSYPALFLSSFQPVKILNRISDKSNNRFRRTLVVIQFILSVFLTIGTIVVSEQLHYLKNKNLGYNKNQLFLVPLRGGIKNAYQNLKIEFKKIPNVLDITGSSQIPADINSNSEMGWEGKDPNNNMLISFNFVDYDFAKTLGIQMTAGREFSQNFMSDDKKNFLINEEMARIMEKKQPLGEKLNFNDINGQIVGVMKNFHYQSVQEKIEPIALILAPVYVNYMVVRIAPNGIPMTMEEIKKTWKRVLPEYPFEYYFLDEFFNRMYGQIERSGTMINYFTLLTIFIACLGLFGLASFSAEKRTKEIGIRKVLGASVSNIIMLLCREYLNLVLLAIAIAWPLSYLIMGIWLQDYAYRISLNPIYFLLAMVFALFLALLSVVFQALRAAHANPIQSIHYE